MDKSKEEINFIDKLEERCKREIDRYASEFHPPFNSGNDVSEATREVLSASRPIFYDFFHHLYTGRLSQEEINDKIHRFTDNKKFYSDNTLAKLYDIRKSDFNEDDLRYIKYTKLTSSWNGNYSFIYSEKYAILDLIFKGSLKSEINKVFEHDMDNLNKKLPMDKVDYLKQKNDIESSRYSELSYLNKIFPLKVTQNQYESELSKVAKNQVQRQINCGGYALEIDNCVFPFGYKDINKDVSCILNNFPFVRLLGNTKLKEDEYLVLYRATSNGFAHHFIKVEDDCNITEKNGSDPVKKFRNWPESMNTPMVVFAVKKNHQNFDYHLSDIKVYKDKDLNFEESVEKALKYKQNLFSYRGNDYTLKKDKNGGIVIVSNEKYIGNALYDGKDLDIEIDKDMLNKINKLSPLKKLNILDGKLLNIGDYTNKKEEKSDSDFSIESVEELAN